jgi:hypothetical protein
MDSAAKHQNYSGGAIGSRRGFTLFEIAISLAIVTVGVFATMLSFSTGIKAQRLARFQLYAGAKMLDVMFEWGQTERIEWNRAKEARYLTQNLNMGRAVDLDRLMMRGGFGMLPLPPAIAARIDSDQDEIQTLLAGGGQLFYCDPQPIELGHSIRTFDGGTRGRTYAADVTLALEEQMLLFGVVGHAQQNALPMHPCMAMPYQGWYPSPPQSWEGNWWENAPVAAAVRTAAKNVTELVRLKLLRTKNDNTADVDSFIQLAGELVKQVMPAGRWTTMGSNVLPQAPRALPSPPWIASDIDVFPTPYMVAAIRYLAAAAVLRTGTAHMRSADVDAYAVAMQDVALRWGIRYASANPYDWGTLRPLNRQTCMDYPLVQWDMMSDPYLYPLSDAGAGSDRSWFPIAATRPISYGNSQTTLANKAEIDRWGNDGNFNLLHRFQAADRCRQLVCWAVDWRSYEDFEAVPAAPIDATIHFLDSRGSWVAKDYVCLHPEKSYFWTDLNRTGVKDWSTSAYAAGTTAITNVGGYSTYTSGAQFAAMASAWEEPQSKLLYVGAYGADRNGNAAFDRGPLPASVRLRAVTVARLNFYDRRLVSAFRY